MLMAVLTINAQTALKKVYDENIDPMEQIDKALVKVGGNWCPWCLRFADFAEKDQAVNKVINDNFVYLHVNYNPRKAGGEEAAKRDARLMQRLYNPARFGFPVFVVLDANGKVLHTQDSSFLEEEKSYSEKKVLRFFNNWTPAAVENKK